MKILKTTILLSLFGIFVNLQAKQIITYHNLKVTTIKPYYKNVIKYIKEEKCWKEKKFEQQTNETGSTVLGGVLGGVLGHQFGKGNGKKLATLGGVVAGSMIANNAAKNSNINKNTYEYVTKCKMINKKVNTLVFSGWKNYAPYGKSKIMKISKKKLKYIKVKKIISY